MATKGTNASKVYVDGLFATVTQQELEPYFKKIGPIKDIHVAKNPPGFAVVEYKDPKDAPFAAKQLNGSIVCGMKVSVEIYAEANVRQAQAMESEASEIGMPVAGRGGNTRIRLVFNTHLDSLHVVDIEELFTKIGPLKQCWVLYLPAPGHFFIEMQNALDAKQARLELDNQYIGGHRMRVTEEKAEFPKMESRPLRVHIRDLPDQIRRGELERELTSIGRVKEVYIKYGPMCQCVVEYFVRAETDMAIEQFNIRTIKEKKVRATIWRGVWDEPKPERKRSDRDRDRDKDRDRDRDRRRRSSRDRSRSHDRDRRRRSRSKERRRSRSRDRRRSERSRSRDRRESKSGGTRLVVTHLEHNDGVRDLEKLFSRAGRVREVIFPPGSFKGYAYVEMERSSDAARARRDIHNERINGHRVSVKEARDGSGSPKRRSKTPEKKKKKSPSPAKKPAKPKEKTPSSSSSSSSEDEEEVPLVPAQKKERSDRGALRMKPVVRTPSPPRPPKRVASPLSEKTTKLGGISKVEIGNKVIVSNINRNTTERDLDDVFFVYGAVKSVRIHDQPVLYAVVEYYDSKGVVKATKAMNGRKLQGATIGVQMYTGPPEVQQTEEMEMSPEPEVTKTGDSRVIITHLPTRVSSTEICCALKRHLERAGAIKNIRVTDADRGEACVEFASAQDAENCVRSLDKSMFYDDHISIRVMSRDGANSGATNKSDVTRGNTLIVQGFPESVDDRKLESQFARFGILTKFQVNRSSSGTTAVIEYHTEADAAKAQQELDGAFIGGAYIKVSMSQKTSKTGHRVLVQNLPDDITDAELKSDFKRFGPITKVTIHQEIPVAATLVYEDQEDAEEAARVMNNKDKYGGRLRVKLYPGSKSTEPPAPKEPEVPQSKQWTAEVASRMLDYMDPPRKSRGSPQKGVVSSTSSMRRRSASGSSEEDSRAKKRRTSSEREPEKKKKKKEKKKKDRSRERSPETEKKGRKQTTPQVSSSHGDGDADEDEEAVRQDITYFERVTIDSSAESMVVRANKGDVLVECDGGHCMMYNPGGDPKYFELWFNHHKKYPLLEEACKFMHMNIGKFRRHLQMMKYTAETFG